ncbi:MAG: hypothetical protein ACC628_22655 [Pirellulaceae bacterium]
MEDLGQPGRRSYPLSALFVLMAACGVVAALVTPAVRSVVSGEVGLAELLGTSLGGSVAVMVLCGVLGLYHYRPVRGFLLGILTGGIIGMVVGPVMVAPMKSFLSLVLTSLIGAILLVVMGAFLHWTARGKDLRN